MKNPRFACLLTILLSTLMLAQSNPVPLVNQPLIPDTIAPGGKGFTLTVNGTGFVAGAVVNWNGSARATTFVRKSRLRATILSSDIAKAGTASVTVTNPNPAGTSEGVFFPITRPVNLAASRSALAAGSSPMSGVTGDFRGNGKLDLAVTNFAGKKVSVFLGNGDGTFQPRVNYDVGRLPGSGIAAGDLRGDGRLDLVVANFGSNDVSVLLGNGDGSFQAAVNYDVETNPTWVVAADLNRDGKLDLIVANSNCTNGGPPCGAGTVSILLGNGDGTFQPQLVYDAGTNPDGVTAGDFNQDGNLDLAVANGNSVAPSTVSILLGNGDGTFQPPVSYPLNTNGASVATADFNHDGKLDLAVVDNIGLLSILLGNGDGTFRPRVDYPAGSFPWGYAGIGDFNEDGNLDIAVANGAAYGGPENLSVFLGNGDGTFQPQIQVATGTGPHGVIVGDFNGDGRLDLATPNYNDNTVTVLLQNGTAALSRASVHFGLQVLDTSSPTEKVTLTNIGSSTLNISRIAITGKDPGDFSEKTDCGASLPPGGHCILGVVFTPTQLGPRTAALTITDGDPSRPQSVLLSGVGVRRK